MIGFSTVVELFHALAMITWVVTIPLLFWHKWPSLSLDVAIYNVIFIAVNRISHWTLDECILTRIARIVDTTPTSSEWFTVKLTKFVFGFIPANKHVTYVEQFIVFIAAVGALWVLMKKR